MIALEAAAFWIVSALLAYIHLGYPLLMWTLARAPRSRSDDLSGPIASSVVLCVHNEESRIRARIRNLAGLQWPGPWELVLVCDGCTDTTGDVAREELPAVRLVSLPVKSGKAAALNAGVRAARYEILIFCDVRQTFDDGAAKVLMAPFAAAEVGAASGSLEIAASEAGGGQGIDAYWRVERCLREWEGNFDSVVGCTGAIYACRKELYREIPDDTLLDDVVIPMQVVNSGSRVLFVPEAKASDPQKLKPELEMRRKLRTLVGNYQMLFRYPEWLLPWKCRIWWQLISHKYLRLTVPWLLLLLLGISLLLCANPFYLGCTLVQVVLYACGILGVLTPALRGKLFTVTAGFLLLQLASARALVMYLAHRRDLRALWRTPSLGNEGARAESHHSSEGESGA